MSSVLLSILIPTVVGREEQCEKLVKKIMTNTHSSVEITIEKDNKEMTIGENRELLSVQSKALFSWQIDDDDDIAPDAIELILEAIKSNPDVDCITFQEHCRMNGMEYKSNHSLSYGDWEGDGNRIFDDGFHFHRTPFYKNVIKTEIAKSVPFQKIRFGEDHAWSRDIKPLLKSEIHIPKDLYYYIYEPKETFEQRYGFDRN